MDGGDEGLLGGWVKGERFPTLHTSTDKKKQAVNPTILSSEWENSNQTTLTSWSREAARKPEEPPLHAEAATLGVLRGSGEGNAVG